MADKIIYFMVTKDGGVDGRDHTDRGGKVMAVSYEKEPLKGLKNAPWCTIEPRVIDTELATREAMAKLSPLDKLILEITEKTANQKNLESMGHPRGISKI